MIEPESISFAAWVRARCNAVGAQDAWAVQPEIEEAEWGHAVYKQEVTKQRDYAHHGL